MVSKIRVYGKAQNRTVLGIFNAYMTMYPQATLEDLCKAFPSSLSPDKGMQFSKENVVPVNVAVDQWYFKKPEELLTTGDGKKVAVVKMWTKPSFDRMVEQAALYGIEIAQFEAADKGIGKKGGFKLEYLNGYIPPQQDTKKKFPLWLIIVLILLALGILAALLMPRKKEVVIQEVVKEVVVRDTVYFREIEEIQKNFNAAQFKVNEATLSDDAKIALHDLAKVLKRNPKVKLNIEGHASLDGNAEANKVLSEKRAQAAVDFLIDKEGIDKSRLIAVGKGTSEPIDPSNPEINRRTEFIIVEE